MLRRYGIFIVLSVIALFLFFPVVSKGMVPIPADYMLAWYEPWKTQYSINGVPTISHKPVVDDAFRHLYPLRVIASRMMREGFFPLWNPYNAAGTPLLAIMHPGYLTPFGLLFLFLSPTLAWTLYVILQPVVLGLATFWYARKLRLSMLASSFVAVSLILSGFSIVRLEYGEFLYILTGLPLLLSIVECKRDQPDHWGVWTISIIVALMLFSGQPHMVIYTLGIVTLYALVRLPFKEVIRLGSFAFLGVAMAAVQLLPSLELYSQSTINRQTSTFIFDRFLLPLSHLITIIIPNYFGNQATYNYFGQHDYVETIAYVGTIPVLFALYIIRTFRKDAVVRFYTILAVLAATTTLSWAGAKLFFLLPLPVLSSDVPSRIFVLVTFALVVLSGIGIDRWEKDPPRVRMQWTVFYGMLLGIVLAVTYVLYRTHAACPPTIPQCRMVSLRTTLIEIAGLAAFVVASMFAFRARRLLRSILVYAPLGIVVVLGLYNAQKFLPFSPRDRVFPEEPVLSALKKETGGFGRFSGIGSADFRANLTTYYGLYSLGYFDPLHVRRYAELVSFVNSGDRKKDVRRSDVNVISDATGPEDFSFRRERFWDLAGVTTLVVKKDDGLFVGGLPFWQDDHWLLYRRGSTLPRAYLTQDVQVIPEPDLELASIFSSDVDIRHTSFVEEAVSGLDIGQQATGSSEIVSYEPHAVTIAVKTPVSSFLVLSDTFYPGWRASVDGKDTPVYRTNYAFRGIIVPKGEHEVMFSYEPGSLKFGATVSLFSGVLWGGLVMLSLRKKRA